jgi:Na+/H+ antiporter NhaC
LIAALTFVFSLMSSELIILKGGAENLTVESSGLGVFLQTIKYRYYPIFMIILIPVLAGFKRDFGPMLVAERKVQVYQRQDGGDGGVSKPQEGHVHPNAPRKDTPRYAYNMLLPIALLVFFIFYLLVKTGETGEPQSFLDKLQSANSFTSLLWGTAAAVCTTYLLYMIQIVQNGELVLPTPAVLKGLFTFGAAESSNDEAGEDDSLIEPSPPRVLMNLRDALESLLYGMGRIFPALIVLTLAWATGSIMTTVGVDRLFASFIQNVRSSSTLFFHIRASVHPLIYLNVSGYPTLEPANAVLSYLGHDGPCDWNELGNVSFTPTQFSRS